jgi:hypothetical protein
VNGKYLVNVGGKIREFLAVITSAGAADSGKLPALDATGRLSNTVMPVGFGEEITVVQASEALAAGDFVNIHNVSGAARVRKADAPTNKPAHGFVLAAVASGGNATVYRQGSNTARTGLTPAADYFLGTSGGVMTTPPTTAGQISQLLGVSVNATTIVVEIESEILIA